MSIDVDSKTWQYIMKFVDELFEAELLKLQSTTCDARHGDIIRGKLLVLKSLRSLPQEGE